MTTLQCTWTRFGVGQRCELPNGHDGAHRVAGVGYITPDTGDGLIGGLPPELILDEEPAFAPGTKLELTGWGTVVEGMNGRLDLLTKPGGALLDLALLTGPGGFEAAPVVEYQQVGSLFDVRIPGTDGTHLLVDEMLASGPTVAQRSDVAQRIAKIAGERLLLDALLPPQPPVTGWKRVRQSVGDAVSNARTRLALTIAPWLEIR